MTPDALAIAPRDLAGESACEGLDQVDGGSWSYFGSKNAIFREIINLIPRHDRYVEPFGGSGAIARNLAPAPESIVLELDRQQARRLRGALPRHRVLTVDAIRWLQGHLPAWGPETVVFVDPPYPVSERRDPRPRYRYELTDADHRELIAALLPARARVLVCGLPWGTYAHAFAGWSRHDLPVILRSGLPGVEVVWTNYRDPFPLHDYRWWGRDKQERQDLARKVARQLGKLERMDRHERAALLRAIADRYGKDGW